MATRSCAGSVWPHKASNPCGSRTKFRQGFTQICCKTYSHTRLPSHMASQAHLPQSLTRQPCRANVAFPKQTAPDRLTACIRVAVALMDAFCTAQRANPCSLTSRHPWRVRRDLHTHTHAHTRAHTHKGIVSTVCFIFPVVCGAFAQLPAGLAIAFTMADPSNAMQGGARQWRMAMVCRTRARLTPSD